MLNIDKNIVCSQGIYTFKNFVDLSKEELTMVLEWRNNRSIRKYMYNRDLITLSDHMAFVNSLNDRTDRYYWLVFRSEEPIGVVDITDVDYDNAKAELGYYMSPQKQSSGIGLDFVFNILHFLFTRGIIELHGNVDVKNKSALLLDEYLGCRFAYNEPYEDNGIKYIPWSCTKKDFLQDADKKNNLRTYYLFIKEKL